MPLDYQIYKSPEMGIQNDGERSKWNRSGGPG